MDINGYVDFKGIPNITTSSSLNISNINFESTSVNFTGSYNELIHKPFTTLDNNKFTVNQDGELGFIDSSRVGHINPITQPYIQSTIIDTSEYAYIIFDNDSLISNYPNINSYSINFPIDTNGEILVSNETYINYNNNINFKKGIYNLNFGLIHSEIQYLDNVYVNITHNLTITADSYSGVYIFENYTDRLGQINTNNPTINIYLGDTIKIINNAFNSHPLLIKETESNILQTNSDNFIEWTPTYIGDYEYYCGNHANMKGIIKVIHSDNFTNPLLTTEINKTFTYNIDNINNYSFTFLNSSDRNGVIYSTNNPDITIYLEDTITINNNSNYSLYSIES